MTSLSDLQIVHRNLHWPTLAKVEVIVAAALVAWLALASPLTAKGPVDMITIEGQGLPDPIEITDTESLEPFDPWFRQFIDWKRRKNRRPSCRQGHLRSLLLP